jgi:hypothetical protein
MNTVLSEIEDVELLNKNQVKKLKEKLKETEEAKLK